MEMRKEKSWINLKSRRLRSVHPCRLSRARCKGCPVEKLMVLLVSIDRCFALNDKNEVINEASSGIASLGLFSLFPASLDQFWVQYQEDMDKSHENPISLGRKAKRNRLSWLIFQLQIHQPHQLFESWMISVSSRYDTWSSMKRNQIKSNQIK